MHVEILSGRSAGRSPVAILVAVAACWAGSVFADRREFRVEDSIEWTHVLPFAPAWSRDRKKVLFSPKGTYALLRTRRGNLERNVNVDELLLYDVGEIQRYARQPRTAAPPEPIVISSIDVAKDDDEPGAIQWVGESQIAFVARTRSGQRQAFVVNVTSRSTRQITNSETDVVGFESAGNVQAHYACVPYETDKPLVVLVDGFDKALPFENNSPTHCYPETPVRLLVSRDGAAPAPIALPPMQLFPWLKRIWVSPDGNHAVIVAPAVDAPEHWSAYTGPLRDQAGFTARFTDPTSMEMLNRTRYLLLDLRTGQVRPLLDAPTGQMAATNSPIESFWTKNGRSVVVTNTFLPLIGAEGNERSRRVGQPAVAEVDIESGIVTAIVREEVATDSSGRVERRMTDFEWNLESQVLTIAYQRDDGSVTRESYQKRSAGWKRSSSAEFSTGPVAIVEEQSLNQRPRMFVEGSGAGRRKLLLDPNPQAETRTFAQARVVHWTDANGLEWSGGLLLPTSYKAGARYPLVVQTHGFKPGAFLLDGPTDGFGAGTAFAAQALANAGFVVLQIEDNARAITLDQREGPAVAEGFRSGIERLIADGLVDAGKVGLCAFSRTGLHALHLLVRHPDMLAALTMSDTLTGGYSIFMYNVTRPAVMDELAKLSDAGRPQLDTIGMWFAREPLYALPKSSAAVRLEGMFQGLGMWEIYSVLKDAGRPVEYIFYPQGSHVLQKPRERLSSQGGNVDWFRFWLQGFEEPDPSKQAMYARWREMRASDRGKTRTAVGR